MDFKKLVKRVFSETISLGLEFASNVITAEEFISTKRSVKVSSIGYKRIEIEDANGRRETIPVGPINDEQSVVVWKSLSQGKTIDIVLHGHLTNVSGSPVILTAEIMKINFS